MWICVCVLWPKQPSCNSNSTKKEEVRLRLHRWLRFDRGLGGGWAWIVLEEGLALCSSIARYVGVFIAHLVWWGMGTWPQEQHETFQSTIQIPQLFRLVLDIFGVKCTHTCISGKRRWGWALDPFIIRVGGWGTRTCRTCPTFQSSHWQQRLGRKIGPWWFCLSRRGSECNWWVPQPPGQPLGVGKINVDK